ncbi:hypothetical protein KAZ93_04165 [Patescibacteria group bacterium]|nr:hypothetical protein [Patescibacteria group bacterium]
MVIVNKNIHRLLVGMYVFPILEECDPLSMIDFAIHSDIVDKFLFY